ncbi:MAG: peptide deformylase, partial [Streptosporangiaceae bacterium]
LSTRVYFGYEAHSPVHPVHPGETWAQRSHQMTARDLRYIGDPVLRTRCEPVTRFDAVLARLIADLMDTVQEPGRAGLAANQIGAGLAAFSYNVDGQLGYVINPVIVDQAGEQQGLEGCLSLPGVVAERRRSSAAVVQGVDLDGEPVTVTGSGELARCLEHETAHLHGELFIDGLEEAERRRVMRQLYASQLRAGASASTAPRR